MWRFQSPTYWALSNSIKKTFETGLVYNDGKVFSLSDHVKFHRDTELVKKVFTSWIDRHVGVREMIIVG